MDSHKYTKACTLSCLYSIWGLAYRDSPPLSDSSLILKQLSDTKLQLVSVPQCELYLSILLVTLLEEKKTIIKHNHLGDLK